VLVDLAQGLVHAGGDVGGFHVPLATWWWSRLRLAGGWNPWVFAGFPANADPQIAGSHPFDLLALVVPAPAAFALESALAPALAGLGAWVYLRSLGAAREARLVAALAFAFGGFVAARSLHHPGMARAALALPFAFAAIEACAGLRLLVALAGATTAILVAGQPQASVYAVGLVIVYALVCGRPREPRRALPLAGGLAAGAALAAPLWLPLAELAAQSTRAAGAPLWPDLRLEAFDAFQLFAPFAGGGGRGPLSPSAASATRCGLVECVTYPGMAVWLILLAAPAAWRRDRRARFWLAVALASLLGATGALGSALELRALERPSRLLLVWSLALPVLGGLALSAWSADPARARRRSALAAAALGALVAWLALRHPDARPAALGAALALSLALLAALAPRSKRAAAAWLALALAADLTAYRLSLPGVGVAPADYERERRCLEPLAGMLRALGGGEHDRAMLLPWASGGNHAAETRLHLAQGYDPLVLRPLAALLGTTPGFDAIGYVNDPTLARPGSHALDLLRVRVLAAPARAALALEEALRAHPDRFEPFHAGADASVTYFRNRRALPVAWLVPHARLVAPGSALAAVRDDAAIGGFDPAREALVEEPVTPPLDPECWQRAAPEERRVSVSEYADDRLSLRLSTPCDALLVTSELAYPGWRARLDGEPAPLLHANGAFRGLRVPAGEHAVELRYRPTLPWLARGLAAAGLVGLSIAAYAIRRGNQGDVP
jgi:hypothetical protein